MSAPELEPARTIVVLAKEPLPGRAKTRLQAQFSPEQAAALARAALEDTLAAVAAVPDVDRVLVLDGVPGDWVPEGFTVVPQIEGGLDRRLAGAFSRVAEGHEGPILLVGMDTPQLGSPASGVDLAAVDFRRADAVIGMAEDGGFWAIGLPRGSHEFYESVFAGVPMSLETTGAVQLSRLQDFALRVRSLPVLRDVDLPDDARAVARAAPGSRFAAAWADATGEALPAAVGDDR
ncbi:DUF2064 domain-containing protein [Cellulomonas sp. PhB143]|uniref:TIGR04282 family arsenosugar biosynthesis glycosyltransferase n=1 Tax=Cellulomonas sp. PhB143 TaxID=2485186 RepID=UPI000F46CC34|nr:DUF2064 domain-containing protein [Cellulomonas sp. PhB143]ROS72065.1 hypothetical protein EDF32_2809 [Cellulomonas sp. PhB143]